MEVRENVWVTDKARGFIGHLDKCLKNWGGNAILFQRSAIFAKKCEKEQFFSQKYKIMDIG